MKMLKDPRVQSNPWPTKLIHINTIYKYYGYKLILKHKKSKRLKRPWNVYEIVSIDPLTIDLKDNEIDIDEISDLSTSEWLSILQYRVGREVDSKEYSRWTMRSRARSKNSFKYNRAAMARWLQKKKEERKQKRKEKAEEKHRAIRERLQKRSE